jgi:predicted O-methyltransferase YrrM
VSTRSIGLSEALHNYLVDSIGEPEVLAELREETSRLKQAGMQISPEQGRFMAWLVGLLGARRCLEVGVFTGYSSLAVASVLPDHGTLVACDVNEKWTEIARRYWERARVAQKIDLRLGPAMETLDALLADGQAGSFDFAFVDADKTNYSNYYDRTLALLRPGGVLAFDNALWSGKVADPAIDDDDTRAIRAVNRRGFEDPRVDASLIPMGDGILLLRKLRD